MPHPPRLRRRVLPVRHRQNRRPAPRAVRLLQALLPKPPASANTSAGTVSSNSESSGASDDAYQAGYDAAKADFNEEKQTLTEEAYEKGKTEAQNEIDSLQEENDQLKTEIQQEQSSSGSAGAAAGILGLAAGGGGGYFSCAQEIPTVNFSPMLSFREADVFSEKDLHRQTEDRRRGRSHRYSSVRALSVSDDFLRKPHFCGLPRIRRFFDLSVFRRRKNGCLRRLFSPRLPHARRDRYLIMIRSS